MIRTLSLAIAALLLGVCSAPAQVTQPIPFNHRIHKDNGLTCEICHQSVFEKPAAGIPRVALCMGCHSGDITQNPAAQPYIESIRRHAEAGTEMGWVRLYTLPHHVYYSHRRHTAIAGLACDTCHGDIGERDTPPAYPIARTLEMDNCMECHERLGAENQCAWCHR